MKKITCILLAVMLFVSLTTTAFAVTMTNTQFDKYIRTTLLKKITLSSVTFVNTNNSKVMAAIAQETAYPGTQHLYIYSNELKTSSSVPTELLEITADAWKPLQSVRFDDTGNILVVRQGSATGPTGVLSIYQVGISTPIATLDVPAKDLDAVTITDNAGSQMTITVNSDNGMGTQVVLDVTKKNVIVYVNGRPTTQCITSVSILSRNDHYLSKDVLSQLPSTGSNNNIVIYVTQSAPGTVPTQTYNFFTKDGTYLMSATKYLCLSTTGGQKLSSIGAPDASPDGKYIAIAYSVERYVASTNNKEQYIEIFDAQTGRVVKDISLLNPSQDIIKGVKFVNASLSDLIVVTYTLGGNRLYNTKTGLDVSDSLPHTASNNNIIYEEKESAPGTVPTQTYNFFTKDGTYLMSATKYLCLSTTGGQKLSSIGAPDASPDGKYIAIAYSVERYVASTNNKEQYIEIFDAQTGKVVKDISLLNPSQDLVKGIKFSKDSSGTIEVSYASAGTKLYSVLAGTQVNNAFGTNDTLKKIDALPVNNQSSQGNYKYDSNMAGNNSPTLQQLKK